MHDCYRPLLVFAPTARDASFASQQAMLDQYADEMMDRNLLYVPVLAQGGHFQAPLDAPYVLLKPSEMNAIRSRFQVGPTEFVVMLVGKDGGEKFRTRKAISVLKLDEIVDAMPMASREKAARSAEFSLGTVSRQRKSRSMLSFPFEARRSTIRNFRRAGNVPFG